MSGALGSLFSADNRKFRPVVAKGRAIQPTVEKAMIPACAATKPPTGFTNRPNRSRLARPVRMAVAFLVVAGSLGLATVTATAQSSSSLCPSTGAAAYDLSLIHISEPTRPY